MTMTRYLLPGAALLLLGLGLGLHLFRPPSPPASPGEIPPPYGQITVPPSPDREFRDLLWQFPPTLPGKTLKHRYAIANESEIPWTVRHVQPACNCTLGELSAQVVKPKETLFVDMAVRVATKAGKDGGSVLIEFNEREAPICRLMFSGEVRTPLSAVPFHVNFARPAFGERPRQVVELHNRGDRDVTIREVRAPEWVQAECLPLDPPAGKDGPRQVWQLVLRADPAKPPPGAILQEEIEVRTDSEELGSFFLLASLITRRPIEVTPAQVDFGPVAGGQTAERALVVEVSPDLGDLTEKDLRVTPEGLEDLVEVQVARDGANRFRVTARFRPKAKAGRVEGVLEIAAGMGKIPPVRVSVVGAGK